MKTTNGSSPNTNAGLTPTRSRWQFLLLLALIALAFLPIQKTWAASGLAIAEIYGGGGNTSATYSNDFVVVFNRSATNIDVNGWSIQYASTAGQTWTVATLATVSKIIPPGGYYLVRLASGGAVGAAIPTADATNTALNMSGTAGKVALLSSTTALTTSNNITPITVPSLQDFVGFGTTASWFEGSGRAPAQVSTTSDQRGSGGCTDTDDNAADFTTAAPTPRNSATTVAPCGGGSAAAISVQPKNTTNWPGSTATFTATVTGDAPITYRWQSNLVTLANGAPVSGATTNTLTINPVDPSFETTYRLIVSNAVGSATSSVVSLVIASNAPAIDSDPLARTGITGKTATFQVLASVPGGIVGAPTTQYRWQSNTVDLADVGQFAGTATPKLTITGLTADNAATYACVVSNIVGSVTSAGAALTVADTGTLAFWNFNIATNPATPEVYYGVGSPSLTGTTNGFFSTADDANDPGNPTKYWGTSQYPVNPASAATNKTYGVRFNVNTTGLRNIIFTLSTRLTTTASRYSRLQYTTDGTTFTDYPGSSTYTGAGSTWDSTGAGPANAGRIFDLSAFSGVRNNPSFGVRVVTETENTATYGASSVTNYTGLSAGYSTSGTVSYDLVDFEASVTNANDVPTVATITSFGMLDTDSPTNISFAIGDTETAAASLTVTAMSFNQTVMPNANLSVSAGGSPRTLTVTPVPGSTGLAPVMVTVADADGNSIATIFNVTVSPGNFAPTITGLVNTNAFTNTPVSQTFTIADDATPVGSLTVSTFSGNVTLVPNVNTTITGSGATRTNTVTGLSGSNGIAPIKVVVTDGPGKSATNTYAVMIRSSTNILAVDSFDYDVAGALNTNSAFMWQTHSGSAGQADTSGGRLNLASPSSDGEDVNLPLFGAPWNTNSSAVLYTSFKAKWLSLPGAIGTYMAHFMDTNTGVATGFGARIWSSTNTAVVDGFRLSINNGSGATNTLAPFPLDLQTNIDYNIVTRFVLSNGVATMWINPTSEGSTSVTATDLPNSTNTVNPINVVAYALRQSTTDGGYGTVTVDDLKVGLSFADATGLSTPAPTPENIVFTTSGSNLILSWTQPNWTALLSGTSITALTTTNVGATSPYTNALSGSQTYFRLYYKP